MHFGEFEAKNNTFYGKNTRKLFAEKNSRPKAERQRFILYACYHIFFVNIRCV